MAQPTGPLPFAVLGPGILMLTRTDITNPTPINVGFCQEFSLDLTSTNKELFGQNKFPLVVGQTTIKATGKIKAAEVSGLAWSTAFYGTSITSGVGLSWAIAEAKAIPATPFQVTATNAATFNSDLGVVYASSAVPFQRVASAPAEGQYSVNVATGVYTFAAADTGRAILLTYTYGNVTGSSLGIVNTAIGATPTFQIDYFTNLNQPTPKPLALRVYAAVGGKHSLGFKLEDFMMPEFDFGFFALPNGKVIDYYYPDTGA